LSPGTFEHALNHMLDYAIELSCFDALLVFFKISRQIPAPRKEIQAV